jgi:hypothetical protein
MAKIYNSDVTKGLQKNAGIQQNIDKTPNELAEKIVPTIETNPELLRRCNIIRTASATNSTSAIIYTTPKNQDFYIVAANLSHTRDAVATSVASSINAVINGATQTILQICNVATTAGEQSLALSFPFPIKVDRDTNITVTNGAAVAYIKTVGTIIGYLDEKSNA